MKKYILFNTATLLCFLLSIVSCANESGSYVKICDIYAEVVKQPISLSEKEGQLAESVQGSFPNFFNEEFVYIMRVDAVERYAALKKSIEMASKSSWDCPVARIYYDTAFK